MKKLANIFVFLVFTYSGLMAQINYQSNIFKVGQSQYTPIYIGSGWAIDEWENGLNFWKPFPSAYSGNYKIFIDQTGKVGIGRKPTSHHLEVAGNVWSSGSFITSDERLKSNIKGLEAESCLDKILLLNGKSYNKSFSPTIENKDDLSKMIEAGKLTQEEATNFLSQASKNENIDSRKHFGFIAQEMIEIFPNLVDESEGIYSIDYISLIPVIIEGMKELKQMIEVKNEKIAYLENQLSESIFNAKDISLNKNTKSVNVFNSNVMIDYILPKNCQAASINIYNMNGSLMNEYKLSANESNITIPVSNYSSGVYIYTLIADGKIFGSNKIVLSN